jgi:hypothetical protein
MREKPILFSGPMVKAILEGRKTQTRRVIKFHEWFLDEYTRFGRHEIQSEIDCPYQVGDILWVRETWAQHDGQPYADGQSDMVTVYRADACDLTLAMIDKWRPSIFMPRWASRITLRVTGVKVERVQEISEEDAKAEGIPWVHTSVCGQNYFQIWTGEPGTKKCKCHSNVNASVVFMWLWDSINAKRGFGWDKNPWVWCYTFEVVK